VFLWSARFEGSGRAPGSSSCGRFRTNRIAKTSPTPKRMRIASRVAESNLIHDVAPTYPPEAGRARIEGTVVLLAVIAKDGTVQDVRVESGLPVLAQAAINAVKQWRYKPYLLNGDPPVIKFGNRWLFDKADLDAYVDHVKAQGA
jgi:periplasmic protein TonB